MSEYIRIPKVEHELRVAKLAVAYAELAVAYAELAALQRQLATVTRERDQLRHIVKFADTRINTMLVERRTNLRSPT